MPLRNSASTSARRYRGLPVSLRTSGSCPRRAHDATDAEVTRNRTATCLRVIRSSSMRLPVIAMAANPRAAGRHSCSPAGLVSASLFSSGSLVDRNQLIQGRRRLPALSPGRLGQEVPKCPVPLALEMVLQVAARNIGQLTDIERPPSPLGRVRTAALILRGDGEGGSGHSAGASGARRGGLLLQAGAEARNLDSAVSAAAICGHKWQIPRTASGYCGGSGLRGGSGVSPCTGSTARPGSTTENCL